MRKLITVTLELPEHTPAATLAFLADELRDPAAVHDGYSFARLMRERLYLAGLGRAAAADTRVTVQSEVRPPADPDRAPYRCPCGHTGPAWSLTPTCGSCGGTNARPALDIPAGTYDVR